MKLLAYTSRIQLLLFLLLFAIFSAVFYLVLRWNVLNNVDEALYNRKENLVAFIEDNPETPFETDNPLDLFTFTPINTYAFRRGYELYSDTLIYEPVDDELDEYRKLISHVEINGKYYQLELVSSHLEANEIISTITLTLSTLFVGLALIYYISQRLIAPKIWKPFYALIDKLQSYRLDDDQPLVLSDDRIDEFAVLNKAISELSRKNKEVFDSQKQFIENASHEMQTPLSVIQTQLEILIEQPELTHKQASVVEGIIASTQRLKKLNKTLLLLSKIENRQFLLSEQIHLVPLIHQMLEYFEEQKDRLQLDVQVEILSDNMVKGNTLLTETIIQNLLKNAFVHNVPHGKVHIRVEGSVLTISNTGQTAKADSNRIFERFYKQSDHTETWGLGLAISRKIAEVSGWKLEYSYTSNQHTFLVQFV